MPLGPKAHSGHSARSDLTVRWGLTVRLDHWGRRGLEVRQVPMDHSGRTVPTGHSGPRVRSRLILVRSVHSVRWGLLVRLGPRVHSPQRGRSVPMARSGRQVLRALTARC